MENDNHYYKVKEANITGKPSSAQLGPPSFSLKHPPIKLISLSKYKQGNIKDIWSIHRAAHL